MRDPGNAGEQQPERRTDDGQRPVGVGDDRLTERADAVRHRLDPGHRGTPGRKGAHQQPQADGFASMAEGRRCDDGVRVAAARRHAPQPDADQSEERQHEGVGRQREQQPGLRRATQVGERHQQQDAKAQRQRVRGQRRNR